MRIMRWLVPGIGLKRWILTLFSGSLLISLALLRLAGEVVPGGQILGVLLVGGDSWYVAVVLLAIAGTATVVLGLRGLGRTVARQVPNEPEVLAQRLYTRWRLERGPRVVAFGGGTGLSVLLRGLKEHTSNITAIATVSDDGGSSGRLRGELGILPPGDIRNCLVALADAEPLMGRLFQHRFKSGSLRGHSFGNLFIGAMSEITGDFERAVLESSKVLAVRGQVLPSTIDDVILGAELEDGTEIWGESAISGTPRRKKRVYLSLKDARPPAAAVAAVQEADLIVIGPGSLYTSVIPNLLVDELRWSVANASALRVLVMNIMTQPGETNGYSVADHVNALLNHAGPGIIDVVLLNSARLTPAVEDRYAGERSFPVKLDAEAVRRLGVQVVSEPLLAGGTMARHDPERLAGALLRIYRRHQGQPRFRLKGSPTRPRKAGVFS